jgi:hypothetical protein
VTQSKSDTVAIPLTSGSAPAPAALIDRDRMLIVEPREGDPLVALGREAEDSEVEGGMVAAGPGRKGKRAQHRCTVCGCGIVVYGQSPSCPMCRETRWEHVEWRPFSLLDGVALLFGTRSQRRRLHAPSSPTAEESIRCLRPGQAGASLER